MLRELTTSIPRGEICGILGANGAGKTTAMRLVMGLIKPKKGSITVLGDTLRRNNHDRIGYMPQLNALYQELSIEENVYFFARMYGMSDRQERNVAVDKA
ncbi:MAG: ATP-binding cassette domain-containing protein, partial [Dehalococcoidia bacterium]|nr:ATP-binding cassette domain-containing protein [Dehalococcoidia bacterium]